MINQESPPPFVEWKDPKGKRSGVQRLRSVFVTTKFLSRTKLYVAQKYLFKFVLFFLDPGSGVTDSGKFSSTGTFDA